jgi:hypothetical protein
MSDSYDTVDLSLSYNAGHNDAWKGNPPKQPPNGILSDRKHQSYRTGHAAGTTAKYYYDKGFEAGRDTT